LGARQATQQRGERFGDVAEKCVMESHGGGISGRFGVIVSKFLFRN